MSYRELRNFTETLRALGYPRLISIENFRTPNFKLVAEIMAWLLKRYDPDSDIPMVLDTEQDRVIFVKTAALFLVQKARIKVNPKKLYEADGYAVQELLKVTSVLYDAIKNQATVEEADDTSNVASVKSMINAKMNDLRTCRQLAAEIPERGASLFDLLSKEVDLREHRTAALGRPLELSEVEKSIRSSVKAVEDEAKQTVNNLSNIASDESTLDAKIEKKKADLERQQKRLAQLQTVRPAYMDEYEKLEERLKYLYSLYVLKFRNLTFMEQTQGDFDRAEVERSTEAEQSMRKMVDKMREEERRRLAEAENLDAAGALDIGDDEFDATAKSGQPTAKWTGNITGAGLSDDDDDDDDDDSLLSDEDEDDGSEAAPVTRRKPPVAAVREESDFSLANGNYDLSDDNDPDPDLDIGQADKRPKPQKAAQPAAPAENDGNSEDDF